MPLSQPASADLWLRLYRAVLWLVRPLVRLRLQRRARRDPDYGPRRDERFGALPASVPRGALWFHTVSAGETIAAVPLIQAIQARFPDLPVLVTTMTPTGSAQVQERLGHSVGHCYAPYDFPDAVRAFFERVEPRLLVLMETELWPNWLAAARARGVPTLLVNGRLSERSARRYARIPGLIQPMLAGLGRIACQYPDHAVRFQALGAPADRLLVTGSVKFDQSLPPDHGTRVAALEIRLGLGGRPVWIAASTHPGEERVVLEAHGQICAQLPDACLLLVPRHPARRAEVAAEVAAAFGPSPRLSDWQTASAQAAPSVILCDTMGMLQTLYGLAQVAFIGGSLVPAGGHNPIEPALCALPLVMGPQRFNFEEVCAPFVAAGVLQEVDCAPAMAAAVLTALTDSVSARTRGERAAAVVGEHRGALERLSGLLAAEIAAAVPEAGQT